MKLKQTISEALEGARGIIETQETVDVKDFQRVVLALIDVDLVLEDEIKEMDALAYAVLDQFPNTSERHTWLTERKAEYARLHQVLGVV